MNEKFITSELSKNRKIFKKLLKNTQEEMILWKPEEKKWCLLEVICHLYDEECDDFRARVKGVLKNPDAPLNPINPIGWVLERKYIEQNYDEMLKKFLKERKKSIKWLKQLQEPIWENAFKHPKYGDMSAKMFLSNWLVHDYLHIRQIIKIKYEYFKSSSKENLEYAGNW